MPRPLTDEMRDPATPPSVDVRTEAREPVTDPTLGIAVPPRHGGTPRNRLVTLGDSLTHGFQSGAIFNTDLSYPMIIAWEMGCDDEFRRPRYPGFGGLPLNLELLIRKLQRSIGQELSWWEVPLAAFELRQHMAEVEEWWERGPGTAVPWQTGIMHNLGVYGWDLRDVLEWDADKLARAIQAPSNQLLSQVVENANERAALRVLESARDGAGAALTPVAAAAALGNEGTLETPGAGDGIETLIVALGANNALKTVVQLKVVWSDAPDYQDVDRKERFTVWDPDHFAAELKLLVAEVKKVKARHVIWATVPHVTIAPIARGIATKVAPGSRYFPYYTRPWIGDADFDPSEHPHLTGQQCRAVDSAIDQYNDAIVAAVKTARQAGLDWRLLDMAGVLDRLAARRYITDHAARPKWWRGYELPAELNALDPKPDSRFFLADPTGRTGGGLFSLDGVHPTTIAYGILAQEFIRVMEGAGVVFLQGDGKTPRTRPVNVDFGRLVRRDTLISSPPTSLASELKVMGWIEELVDPFRRLFARD